jgi:hypothetical protein
MLLKPNLEHVVKGKRFALFSGHLNWRERVHVAYCRDRLDWYSVPVLCWRDRVDWYRFLVIVGEIDWTGTVVLFCVGEMD